jgi:hypothetical protein
MTPWLNRAARPAAAASSSFAPNRIPLNESGDVGQHRGAMNAPEQ